MSGSFPSVLTLGIKEGRGVIGASAAVPPASLVMNYGGVLNVNA